MLARNGAGSDSVATESGARKIVGTGERDGQSFKAQNPETQTAIRAELTGSDTCIAAGITVRAAAPVLTLCRQLIEAGHDPRPPLHAYRGDVLCLVMRAIGEAAALEVAARGAGFVLRAARTAPPMRGNRRGTP